VQPFSREAQPSATQVQDEQSKQYAEKSTQSQVQSAEHDVGGQDGQDERKSGQVGKPTPRESHARARRVRSGKLTWRVVRHNRSATFGNPAVMTEGGAHDTDSVPATFSIQFDESGLRLEGSSIPSIGLTERAAAAFVASTGSTLEQEEFLSALRSRFSDQGRRPVDGLRNQPYVALRDQVREVHSWSGTNGGYPRAVVFPAGDGKSALSGYSLSAVPIMLTSGFMEAFLLSINGVIRDPAENRTLVEPRPSGSGSRKPLPDGRCSAGAPPEVRGEPEDAPAVGAANGRPQRSRRFRILPERPMVDGHSCTILEGPRPRALSDAEGEPDETWRYWVDPERENVIVRCMKFRNGKFEGPQYDIEYDCDESGAWLPSSISVLLMGNLGDPLDELVVVRTEEDRGWRMEDRTEGSQWQPVPGMWVDDYVDNTQFFVRADGSRRKIAFNENYAGLTYGDLQAEGAGIMARLGIDARRLRGWTYKLLGRAISWPGILVTLPAVYLLWIGGRGGYNRWRRIENGR